MVVVLGGFYFYVFCFLHLVSLTLELQKYIFESILLGICQGRPSCYARRVFISISA